MTTLPTGSSTPPEGPPGVSLRDALGVAQRRRCANLKKSHRCRATCAGWRESSASRGTGAPRNWSASEERPVPIVTSFRASGAEKSIRTNTGVTSRSQGGYQSVGRLQMLRGNKSIARSGRVLRWFALAQKFVFGARLCRHKRSEQNNSV